MKLSSQPSQPQVEQDKTKSVNVLSEALAVAATLTRFGHGCCLCWICYRAPCGGGRSLHFYSYLRRSGPRPFFFPRFSQMCSEQNYGDKPRR